MADTTVSPHHDARQVAALLDLPEIKQLIADLDETRWTGRPGYPVRSMVGAALVKAVYALPTWTRTARLIAEHAALREVIGGSPSNWACYRFAVKLREHGDMLTACLDRVLATLHEAHPEMGQTVAIDGSDMPAYANGHKHVGNKNGPLRTRWADPDAGWGHRSSISTRKGGAYYGYKLHCAVDTATELPVAWTVKAANEPEQAEVAALLDALAGRGFTPGRDLDKGYDGQPMHDVCESRGIRPVIALIGDAGVKAGKHKPPDMRARRVDIRRCGRQARRDEVALPGRRVQARLGVDQGGPAAPAHPARHRPVEVPLQEADRRGARVRPAQERLRPDSAAGPRLPRVTLHANLTILAQLASALLITQDT